MKCPRCGSDVRPSQKTPGYYLCDTCRKRYPASVVIDDSHDDFFDTDDLDIDFDTDLQETPKQNASHGSVSSRSSSGRSKSRKPASSGSSRPGSSKKETTKPARSKVKNNRAETKPGKQNSEPVRRNSVATSTNAAPTKKKKGGILKVLLVLLLLVLIAGGAVFGLVHFNIIDNPLDMIKKSKTTQESDKNTTKTNPLTTYQVGETAEYNGIKVKAIGYEESSGDDWSAPAEGNVFVFVNIEITNNTDEELPVSSMASFESYCGEEKLAYSPNAFTALATNTDRKQMDGSIASGDTLNGYLCLEVPADWTTLTIHYANNVWSNDNVQFEIKKQ